jgi:sterol desaturase/sphingolipid hydroxylase (fatty acid hydroxylase superfamily)
VPSLSALVVRSAAFLSLVALIAWPLERLWPRERPQRSLRTWLGDLGWLALSALTLHAVAAPLLSALSSRLPPPTPAIWRFLASFLGAELLAYALHRCMHEVPWLWRFHALHHAPRHLDWLKTWRQHPLDLLLHTLVVALPGLLLGASLSSLPSLVLLRRVYTALLHANLSVRWGPLAHLVATPDFHHAHHALDWQGRRGNYAGTFPWLDRLFGTFLPP